MNSYLDLEISITGSCGFCTGVKINPWLKKEWCKEAKLVHRPWSEFLSFLFFFLFFFKSKKKKKSALQN